MSSRSLFGSAGAALLGPLAGPQAGDSPEEQFITGLVADPTESDRAYNVQASITGDGSGFGLFSDPVDPGVTSDVEFHARHRRGNQYRWEGTVIRSTNPRFVDQPFVLSATVHGESAAPLELAFMGRTYSGRGLVVIAIIAVLIALLVPAVQKVR